MTVKRIALQTPPWMPWIQQEQERLRIYKAALDRDLLKRTARGLPFPNRKWRRRIRMYHERLMWLQSQIEREAEFQRQMAPHWQRYGERMLALEAADHEAFMRDSEAEVLIVDGRVVIARPNR